jgi:hypothetical protein
MDSRCLEDCPVLELALHSSHPTRPFPTFLMVRYSVVSFSLGCYKWIKLCGGLNLSLTE